MCRQQRSGSEVWNPHQLILSCLAAYHRRFLPEVFSARSVTQARLPSESPSVTASPEFLWVPQRAEPSGWCPSFLDDLQGALLHTTGVFRRFLLEPLVTSTADGHGWAQGSSGDWIFQGAAIKIFTTRQEAGKWNCVSDRQHNLSLHLGLENKFRHSPLWAPD